MSNPHCRRDDAATRGTGSARDPYELDSEDSDMEILTKTDTGVAVVKRETKALTAASMHQDIPTAAKDSPCGDAPNHQRPNDLSTMINDSAASLFQGTSNSSIHDSSDKSAFDYYSVTRKTSPAVSSDDAGEEDDGKPAAKPTAEDDCVSAPTNNNSIESISQPPTKKIKYRQSQISQLGFWGGPGSSETLSRSARRRAPTDLYTSPAADNAQQQDKKKRKAMTTLTTVSSKSASSSHAFVVAEKIPWNGGWDAENLDNVERVAKTMEMAELCHRYDEQRHCILPKVTKKEDPTKGDWKGFRWDSKRKVYAPEKETKDIVKAIGKAKSDQKFRDFKAVARFVKEHNPHLLMTTKAVAGAPDALEELGGRPPSSAATAVSAKHRSKEYTNFVDKAKREGRYHHATGYIRPKVETLSENGVFVNTIKGSPPKGYKLDETFCLFAPDDPTSDDVCTAVSATATRGKKQGTPPTRAQCAAPSKQKKGVTKGKRQKTAVSTHSRNEPHEDNAWNAWNQLKGMVAEALRAGAYRRHGLSKEYWEVLTILNMPEQRPQAFDTLKEFIERCYKLGDEATKIAAAVVPYYIGLPQTEDA
jgi:hypothetical protein